MMERFKSKKLLIPVTFIMAFLQGCYICTYQFLLLNMAEDLDLGNAQIGILAGVMFGAQICIPLIFGMVSDKIGKKIFVIIAACMILSAQLLYMWADSFVILLLLAVLGGSGFGAVQTLSLGILSDNYTKEAAMKYTNLSQTILSLGAFVAPLIAAKLLESGWVWRQLFLPIAVPLGAVVVLYLLTDIKKQQQPKNEAVLNGPNCIKTKSLFRSPLLYMLMFWGILWSGAEASTTSFLDAFVTLERGAGSYAALAMSLFWLMQIPSRALSGFIKRGYLTVMVIFMAVFAVNVTVLVNAPSMAAVLTCFAICGFLSGPIWPAMFITGQQAFPMETGTAGSLCGAFSGVGSFMAATAGGFVAERYSISSVYFMVIGMVCMAILFAAAAHFMVHKRAYAVE